MVVDWRIALLAFALGTGSARAADDAVPFDPFTDWTTIEHPSGLRVWIRPLPAPSPVGVSATLPVGALHDPPGLEGLAHLTEHVVLYSSPGRTEQELRDEVRERDGYMNGSTSLEHTEYYVQVAAEHCAFALRWMRNRLFWEEPISSEAVDAERKAVILEKELAPEPPLVRVLVPWMRPGFRWTASPWARAFGLPGEIAHWRGNTWGSVRRITADDINRFVHRWYAPQNVTIWVVGDVVPSEVIAELDGLLADLSPSGETARSTVPANVSTARVERFESTHKARTRIRVEWRLRT